MLAYSDGLSLLPLFAPEFLAGLPDKQVGDLVPRWQKLRPSADDDVKRRVSTCSWRPPGTASAAKTSKKQSLGGSR